MEEKLTPKKIAEAKDNPSYSIPIYQRLFEWDTDNIHTLLSDLWHNFDVTKERDDYYIGMLTSTKENELVDGQQRFVVMMLMGCVLKEYYSDWGSFIVSDEQPRLHFSSRPKDKKYLEALIKGEQDIDTECINVKMKNGIEQISAFLHENGKGDRTTDFARYIYEHLSFFITELPGDYSPTNLNLYFERMNTTGRNLEQHEILKVKLLRHLDDSSTYMQLWNRLADVDTLLITQRDNEKEEDLHVRKDMVIQKDIPSIINENIINGMNRNDTDETSDAHSIEQIAPKNKRPSADRYKIHDSRCPLNFPELLLQTLYWLKVTKKPKEEPEEEPKDNFFNTSNLLDTFSNYLPYEGENVKKEDIESFMLELLRCRLILDVCFIRSTESGYSLDMNKSDEDESKKKLMMYESMLYVSSSNTSYYKWFGWLMSYVMSSKCVPSADELCKELKRKDNEEHKEFILNEDNLSYHNIDRYWFWRLDYYLWENRKELFIKEETRAVADNYVFRRNRSIEHIAPQTPKSDSAIQWNDTKEDRKIRDSFGNLAMISSGLNSSLSNESFEVKRAHVASYCSNSKVGSIESLKLLWVYEKYKAWGKDKIVEHECEMMALLNKKSLNDVSDK